MSTIEDRLETMGITLPPTPPPMANYVTTMTTGNFLYTSGAGPFLGGKPKYQGRLGTDLTVEEGYEAAKLTAINLLSLLKGELGNLDRIERIVKVLGFVNSSLDFYDQPKVMNGASDLFVEALGEKGQHTRSALGTSVLPFNIPVEIEMVVQIKND